MNSSFLINPSNSSFDTYYTQVDLTNKYNINSTYTTPSLNKLVFSLPLNQFILQGVDSKDNTNIQIKSFLILFIVFSLVPFIVFKDTKNKVKITKDSDTNKNFALKIIITNKNAIYYILKKKLLFVNAAANEKDRNSIHVKSQVLGEKKSIHSRKYFLPATEFVDIKDYEEFKVSKPSFNELKIDLTVNFFSPNSLNFNNELLLKNLINL